MSENVREVLEARIAELEKALKPFARHVGKTDAPVTLKIGNATWTDTLTGADFANASHVLSLRNPSYRDWLAAKGTGDE